MKNEFIDTKKVQKAIDEIQKQRAELRKQLDSLRVKQSRLKKLLENAE